MTTSETPAKERREPALAPGNEVEVDFTDLLANGQAVGRTAGMVLFCFGPLPGERARVRVQTIKPKYAVAKLLQLLAESADRSKPFCPVFGTCGGCQTQHLGYAAQLRWKREVVRGALTRIGGFSEVNVRETVGMANPRAYRNKMSLVVDVRGAKTRLGFYQQRSHAIVPIDGCPIVTPQLDALISRLDVASAREETRPAFARARHIVARSAGETGGAVVTFTTRVPDTGVEKSARFLMNALTGTVGITNSFDLANENAIVGRSQRSVAGSPEIEEEILGVRYRVSAGSFFQVNVEIVARIFEHLRPKLEAKPNIVDLYCGAGTFALFFAKHGCTVFGIEESRKAVEEANANARLNGLHGLVDFRSAKVENALSAPAAKRALHAANVVFLDPPRKGSDAATLEAVAAAQVPSVWYLSCEPATLARDLKFLAEKGYTLNEAIPFDMFPQTGHVETLAILSHHASPTSGATLASQ